MAALDATAEDTTDNVTQEHDNNNTTHATGHLPQQQPPSSPPPISDLINDLPTSPTDPFSNLLSSRHNPDFRIRNQHKALKLATILSDLQLQLFAAQRAEDQVDFDALYRRICKAGDGLKSLAGDAEEGKVKDDSGFIEFMRVDWKEDQWFVEHGGRVEEGERHDELSGERVRVARGEYEERFARMEGVGEAGGDDGDEIGEDGGVAVGEGGARKESGCETPR